MKDLVLIYISYIRSLLEQSCVVWHSSLTEADSEKLERVQKVSLRIILKDSYECYDQQESSLSLTQYSADHQESFVITTAQEQIT